MATTVQVTVLPLGQSFAVEEEETVLQAALRQGLAFPYGCRHGDCGSCKGRLLQGSIQYPQGVHPPGISDSDAAAGWVLFCQAQPLEDLTIEVRTARSAQDRTVRTLPVRIAGKTALAEDVMELCLQLPANERLDFLPGQFIDVLLKDGQRRSYSLANAPHEDALLYLHIKRVPDGRFSGTTLTEMKLKSLLRIEGPLGSFTLDEASARPRLFIGGGTGFAPLKSMLDHLRTQGLDRPHHLFWGARDADGIYAPDWLQAFAAQESWFRCTPVLSEHPQERVAGFPAQAGWLHDAVCHTYPNLSGFDVYMAGPPPMIHAARAAFLAAGLPEEQLYYDSFEAATP
jgi:CDP-4-dehydro-6-deoxyglucose reductase